MTRTIFNLLFALSVMPAIAAQENRFARADALFAARDNPASLKQADSTLEHIRNRNPLDYDALWRVARSKYYLSDRETDEAKKIALLEAGIAAAKKAVALDDKRAEAHFWLGATTGEYADLKGAFTSLGLIKKIRKAFEAVLKIDPAHENGAAHLALGQMDVSLPGIFGGSDRRGIQTLENGLKAAPTNAELKLALADIYSKSGKKDEARKLLESALSENDPLRTPLEMEELKTKARRLLEKLKQEREPSPRKLDEPERAHTPFPVVAETEAR